MLLAVRFYHGNDVDMGKCHLVLIDRTSGLSLMYFLVDSRDSNELSGEVGWL
jgi:hypothetical protein